MIADPVKIITLVPGPPLTEFHPFHALDAAVGTDHTRLIIVLVLHIALSMETGHTRRQTAGVYILANRIQLIVIQILAGSRIQQSSL